MAQTSKTQHSKRKTASVKAKQKPKQARASQTTPPHTADAAEIARYFMSLWQEQWHEFIKNPPPAMHFTPSAPASNGYPFPFGAMNPFGQNPFGMPSQFGHNPNHGKDSSSDAATHMAAAALATSQQCLELLEQFRQRLDALTADTQPAARRAKAKSASPKTPKSRPAKSKSL